MSVATCADGHDVITAIQAATTRVLVICDPVHLNFGRLTAPFSGRPLTDRHAGAQDLFEHYASSPAARHFIYPGPLQRIVMRHLTPDAGKRPS